MRWRASVHVGETVVSNVIPRTCTEEMRGEDKANIPWFSMKEIIAPLNRQNRYKPMIES